MALCDAAGGERAKTATHAAAIERAERNTKYLNPILILLPSHTQALMKVYVGLFARRRGRPNCGFLYILGATQGHLIQQENFR